MRTTHIQRLLAKRCRITNAEAGLVLAELGDIMADALAADGRIQLKGLGTFQIRLRPPRYRYAPSLGRSIECPARWYTTFRPVPALTRTLRNKPLPEPDE